MKWKNDKISITEMAKSLGISRQALYQRMKRDKEVPERQAELKELRRVMQEAMDLAAVTDDTWETIAEKVKYTGDVSRLAVNVRQNARLKGIKLKSGRKRKLRVQNR